MKKSVWFWLCFVLTLVLGLYFATRIIMVTTGRSRLGYIRNISITTDSPHENMAALAAATGVAPGTRSYATRMEAINERIGAVPGVQASAVRRLANGNLAVHVRMHQTVALWTDDGKTFFPISADGTIIKTPRLNRDGGGVLFWGPVPKDIAQITHLAQNFGDDLDYLEWIENRRWNLHTRGGITVLLPQESPDAAISALLVLDQKNQILSKKLQTIDMRDPARVLVK